MSLTRQELLDLAFRLQGEPCPGRENDLPHYLYRDRCPGAPYYCRHCGGSWPT